MQSPEDAALQHAAEEAGAYGDVASFLGPIEDHWKSTLTRWFHLDNVVFEDDYKRPLDIWKEKDLRKRKWVALISEEVCPFGTLLLDSVHRKCNISLDLGTPNNSHSRHSRFSMR